MIFNLQFYENHKSDQLEKIRHTIEISLKIWAEFVVLA